MTFSRALEYALPYCAGLLILFSGQAVIHCTLKNLWTKLGMHDDGQRRPGEYHSAFLGAVESALYLGAFLYEKPEFIGVWLGLKMVVTWRHWEYDIPVKFKGERRWILGRNAYNMFLLGNALVVTNAAAAWKGTQLFNKQPEIWVLLIAIGVISLALAISSKIIRADDPLTGSDPRVSKKRRD